MIKGIDTIVIIICTTMIIYRLDEVVRLIFPKYWAKVNETKIKLERQIEITSEAEWEISKLKQEYKSLEELNKILHEKVIQQNKDLNILMIQNKELVDYNLTLIRSKNDPKIK